MTPGKIVLLNGISSSGKTTIAKELQDRMRSPWLYTGWDHFLAMLPEKYTGINQDEGSLAHEGIHIKLKLGVLDEVTYGKVAIKIIREMHHFISNITRNGSNLIVDDLIPKLFLKDYLHRLEGLQVYFIGLKCPLEEIERREKLRKNRFSGTARLESRWIHDPGCYDMELDTSRLSVSESVDQIMTLVAAESEPQAFRQLKAYFKNFKPLPNTITFK
ncbi:MAG: AAA family ATPase [Proteobacteria bacterium]|nr:AAA family ATPase [Pseudomonadota bacterium]